MIRSIIKTETVINSYGYLFSFALLK